MADVGTTAAVSQGETTQTTTAPTTETQTSVKPASTGQTTEKMFTQSEVETLVQERLSRVRTPAQAPSATEAVNPVVQDTALQEQLAAVQHTLVQTEVKAQMAMSGVQSEKVERACRLVDPSKCVDKAHRPDVEKIKAEIEALVKDFPELKATTAEGSAGFKIGADGTTQDKKQENKDAVSRIFGNTK